MSMTKEQLRAMFANIGKGKTKTKKTSLKRPTTGKKSKVQRWQPTGYTGVGLVKTKSLKEMKRTPIKKNKITHLQLQKQMDKYEKEHSTRKKDIKAHLKEYEKEHSTRKKDIQEYLKGQKDGRKIGKKTGGRGRNETSNCRHPDKK